MNLKRNGGFTLVELLIVIAIIGILATIAIPNLISALQRARQKKTMADMKTVATAVEMYNVDNNSYPPGSCATGLFVEYGAALTVGGITGLTPTYVPRVINVDGWGNNLLYNLSVDKDSYNIVSLGRDGEPQTQVCGTTTSFNDDIIYSNGSFIQWPEGSQQ